VSRFEVITDKSQISEDRYEEFDAIVGVLGRVGGPFSAMFHSPGLAQKVMEAGAHIRLRSTLTMGERELIILAVAREKDGAYEWAAHVGQARNNGVSESTIEVVRDNGELSGLDEHERDIVEYVRQLLRTNRVTDELYNRLLERKGIRWVVELTGTIGQYQYISAINNAFELQPHAGADVLPVPAANPTTGA
jgi:4-carboxymuconolactone decarboxylase